VTCQDDDVGYPHADPDEIPLQMQPFEQEDGSDHH